MSWSRKFIYVSMTSLRRAVASRAGVVEKVGCPFGLMRWARLSIVSFVMPAWPLSGSGSAPLTTAATRLSAALDAAACVGKSCAQVTLFHVVSPSFSAILCAISVSVES
jgi:hypothetical protein